MADASKKQGSEDWGGGEEAGFFFFWLRCREAADRHFRARRNAGYRCPKKKRTEKNLPIALQACFEERTCHWASQHTHTDIHTFSHILLRCVYYAFCAHSFQLEPIF